MSSDIGLLSDFESPVLEKVGGCEPGHWFLTGLLVVIILLILWCSCGVKFGSLVSGMKNKYSYMTRRAGFSIW